MLIRLQSGFHFRRGIPVRFRTALGKREIWHSLETLDRNLARTRACAMYGLTSQLFECISLAMSHPEETSSLNTAVETFQEALSTSDLHPVQQDLFQSIIQTYDSEIQALKARYKTMNPAFCNFKEAATPNSHATYGQHIPDAEAHVFAVREQPISQNPEYHPEQT